MKKLIMAFGRSLAVVVLLVAAAQAEDYAVDPAANADTVFFRSTAALEFIEGKTTDLIGGFRFDPDSSSSPVTGVLRVDLRTLKTGIETRDRHMRERHLHTGDYPFAYFEFTGIAGVPAVLQPDSSYKETVQGYFYIHGGKRRLSATAQFWCRGEADTRRELTGRAKFSLKLDEYGIERPRALFLKLAETVEVEVIFSARNDLKLQLPVLPDWKLVP